MAELGKRRDLATIDEREKAPVDKLANVAAAAGVVRFVGHRNATIVEMLDQDKVTLADGVGTGLPPELPQGLVHDTNSLSF